MSQIIYIKTEEELDKLKESDKLLLIKFGAKWCGPCKQIKSNLEKIAENDNNVIVIDIDVDEAQDSDWSWASEVENLPTFRFIRNGVQLEEYSGSKIEKIQDIIRKLC
jgi:thioredoxin 1